MQRELLENAVILGFERVKPSQRQKLLEILTIRLRIDQLIILMIYT
jgi:hypothetical protein